MMGIYKWARSFLQDAVVVFHRAGNRPPGSVKRGGAALPYPWGGVLVFLLAVQIGKMVERGKWTALRKDVWNGVA